MSPADAITLLAQPLAVTNRETTELRAGRVLAQPILADRDSPAADVSAMDGYAVRMVDLSRDELAVVGQCQPGQPPPPLPPGTALRIFTGAVVPQQAELVVPREQTIEADDAVRWQAAARRLASGANIRRQGENAPAGAAVLAPGTLLSSASIAAAVSFGASRGELFNQLRCSVIVTGNELLGPDDSVQPWQLRDSNGPTAVAMMQRHPWINVVESTRCGDDPAALTAVLLHCLDSSDAVILTGGVSVGDHDHVPAAVQQVGGRIVFHRLPIRPGKPVLGAVGPGGQLLLGLPGNPVSAACCLMRIGLPLLRKMSGQRQWWPAPERVLVDEPGSKTLPLWWMRLVRRCASPAVGGWAEVVPVAARGSGDLVALAASDGFIEQPPEGSGTGPWDFYRW